MLVSIHIENVAVAKSLDLDFEKGFTVLTGETGAGKSIIIDSIGIISGGKMSRDIIRHGEERAYISALFSDIGSHAIRELENLGFTYSEEEALTISRSISAEGKSICKINGRTMPLSAIKNLSGFLIDIHGQNESLAFMNKTSHLTTLDTYADAEVLLVEYRKIYEEYQTSLRRLKELLKAENEKGMMVDILRYQISEIEAIKLSDPEEEDKLYVLKNRLKNVEKISKHANLVYRALYENEKGASACYLIDRAIASLGQLESVMEEAPKLASRLTDFRYEIESIADTVRNLSAIDETEDPATLLNRTEHRINQIQRLKGKYGSNILEILTTLKTLKSRLEDFEQSEDRIANAKKEASAAHKRATEIAKQLTALRKPAAEILSRKVCESLAFLDMPKVKFVIKVDRLLDTQGKDLLCDSGTDDVEFLVSTNPGEPLMPMGKVASGGELSRIILALKSILNDSAGTGTSIFDEVDTGVSGSTAQKIGIKLKETSKTTQVVCVTHSAQIACLADQHHFIKKAVVNDRSEASVLLLDRPSRIAEIARIIGGIDVTNAQLKAAEEMIIQGEKLCGSGEII